jgi:hypothetical protein
MFFNTVCSVLAAAFVAGAFSPAADARAQGRGRAPRAAAGRPAPRFEDYPAGEIYRGRPAPVRLDSRRARMFRTRLREDSRTGPNFAGHYTVVVWGCGTGCAQSAVVDARTGRVYFPPLEYHDIPDTEDERERARTFRLDSRLLVLTEGYYDGAGRYTAHYYIFDNNRFRLLRKSVEQRPEPSGQN